MDWSLRNQAHYHTSPSLVLLAAHEGWHQGICSDLPCVPTRQCRPLTPSWIIGAPTSCNKTMGKYLRGLHDNIDQIRRVRQHHGHCRPLQQVRNFHCCTNQLQIDEAAYLFIKHVVKLWGVSKNIVSNWNPQFTKCFWIELFKMLGINLKFSTSFHPQMDGQTKRINDLLEMYLKALCKRSLVRLGETTQYCSIFLSLAAK